MTLQVRTIIGEDLQPRLDQLRTHLHDHRLPDSAAGRAQAVVQMLDNECPLDENRYFDCLRHLAVHYDSQRASEIDPWLEALVASRPDVAGKLYVNNLTESDRLAGNEALLRAGVDLAAPVPGAQFSTGNQPGPTSTITDASPLVAMVCYLDTAWWKILQQKDLLPRYDKIPYAGRVRQADGSFVDMSLLDYMLKVAPAPEEHLLVLEMLDRESTGIQAALADGAAKLIKQRLIPDLKQGHEMARAALFIGAGADLVRVADGIKDEKMCSLPSILASVQSFEYREYVLEAAEAIVRAAQAENLPEELHPVFDLGFRDEDGFTPLHMAAGYGYPEVVACYVAAGADVNACDHDLNTPLHEAAKSSVLETVEILLDAGANVDARTRSELTAEMLAQNNRRPHIAQMIAAHRAREAVTGVLKGARTANTGSSYP